MVRYAAALVALAAGPLLAASAATECYKWKNVKIGGGGGFVDGIVFNPTASGIAYARTDIGGAYRLNADDTWTPMLDWVDSTNWNYMGVDAIATDPIDTNRVVMAVGLYTNEWDPNMGSILRSTDRGATWSATKLSFKVGGNMPGRGMGERLAIDPNLNSIIYFGARSGNGLWKSTDYGATWAKVTSFTSAGTFIPNPSDPSSYQHDIVGIAWVTFDSTSGSKGAATPRIFVGVADKSNSIWVSTNGGSSWSLVSGQPSQSYLPHKGVLSPSDKMLYITYSDGAGPYDGTLGAIWKYSITAGTWTDITPVTGSDLYYGFGGFAVDLKKPGTIMVAALNAWWPEGLIFRSTNSGSTWSRIWEWGNYPDRIKHFSIDSSLAPWLSDPADEVPEPLGWMMESMVIDPFNSDHWLYGTGATVYGGRDLTKWDTVGNITIKALADGIEETAILDLLSPPSQHVKLVSSVGDINGFIHDNLDTPRTSASQFHNPKFATTFSLGYAGNKPLNYVRVGGEAGNIALSTDGGVSWYSHPQSTSTTGSNGVVSYSANADTIVWSTTNIGVIRSTNSGSFTTISSVPANAYVAADRRDNTVFYALSGNKFYVSKNTGSTFTQTVTLGGSTGYKIVPNPGTTGDVWVSTDAGLFRSTNTGTSFTQVSGPTWAAHFDLGAPKTSGGYWSIAAMATIDGKKALYRSDDAGASWVQINDATMGFGTAESNRIAVDYSQYGRVFIGGGNGRGIFYGVPGTGCSGGTSTTTTRTTTTTTTTTSSRTTTTSSRTTTPSTTTSRTTTTPVTTTSRTTTTSSRTTTTTASGAQQTLYGQCGGIGWTGPTACVPPAACVVGNPYYSQCL
ncbi:hypothetical protein H072_7465 [Dactylellina haptotyla CBS 200.50]|uniref:CBM1 domain-containing protein n=1 Tax=Dactylellina haptotyla (strain CBS 200.50) TaxID=1284197 RepID=S8BU10_DACHA|nr:hypothetical protein H072_7465 [Dactylellina haptotyla CBS 200.50]